MSLGSLKIMENLQLPNIVIWHIHSLLQKERQSTCEQSKALNVLYTGFDICSWVSYLMWIVDIVPAL